MGLIVIPLCALLLCIGVARGIIKVNNTRIKNLERMLNVLDNHLEILNEMESDASRRHSINQIKTNKL